jgi:hypothetical protein
MENGPETTSQAHTTASSTDEVLVSDVPAPENVANDALAVAVDAETPLDETFVADVSSTETVFSADETVDVVAEQAVEPEAVPETEALDLQEAPVPQPVQMFDLGNDLGVHPEAPTFDMAEETVEPTVSNEVVDEPVDNAQSDDDEAEATIAVETITSALSADDEIFEQVMGSSRVEDIPVPRRSRPGSIPLPPQVAEEQIRRQRSAAPAPADSRGHKHPLPASQRSPQRPGPSAQTSPRASQPSAPQAVDVICPKCQRTTSTRFTFCMKCGTDFPSGYVASLTGHSPHAATPGGHGGVRDTRTTVRQINSIHEGRGSRVAGAGMGTSQTDGEEELPRLNAGMLANPFLVAFLSFLMPGLGHMLIGEHKKGLPWLFAGIAAMAFIPSWTFLMWVPLFLRVASAINAYQLAVIKQGEQQRGPFDADDDA